jgi:hypothetical protein
MLSAATLRPSRPARRLLPWLLALATATCSTDRTGPGTDGRGYFGFRPVYQLAEGRSLSQFGIVADTVRVRITRPIDQLVIDTAVVFPADSSSLSLALPVELESSPELLDVVITISAQGQVIFVDSLQVDVVDGPPGSSTPPTVVFQYIGPGNNIAVVDITPQDTTITFGDTVFFASTAEDSAQAPVANFYLSWTSSDSNVARVNGAGRVVAGTARGTAEIVGLTPTGIADTSTITIAPSPVIITADSGNGQTATVTDSLGALFVARVKGADSLGISGVAVQFQAVTAGGAVRDTIVITDATGRARTRGVVGDTARTYTYTATAVGTGLPAANFSANALTGAAALIAKQSGDAQTDTIGKVLPLPFVVLVTDAFGNPVVGAGVVFTRTVGNGTVADDTVFTVGGGTASVGYTLGNTVGTDSIRAQLAGTSAFVDFTANAISATPTAVNVDSGDAQTAIVQAAFTDSLVVRVLDIGLNPVPGATVQWDEETGSLALSGTSSITGADGRARIGVTAGTVAETVTVLATIVGVADTANFTLTVLPGAPASMTIASGNGQSGTEGTALPLWPEVRITDGFNNPIAGLSVDFAVTIGGGTIDSAISTTDSTGRANSGEWTLGPVAGLNQVRATSAAVPADTLLFDATGTPAGTTKLWTGLSTGSWGDPNSWSPVGVPVSTDNVFIPASAPDVLSATPTTIAAITIEAGTTLIVDVPFTITGDADLSGGVTGGGAVNLAGSGGTVRGTIQTLQVNVTGDRSLNGPTSMGGALDVSSAALTVNGQALSVAGNVSILGSGSLVMTNPADSVDVGGTFAHSASVAGLGTMTNGVLVLRGDLDQVAGAADNFRPSNSHRTRFAGSAPQTVTFATPGSSGFLIAEFANASGVTLASDISALGLVQVNSGTVTGVGRTATLNTSLVAPYPTWQVSTTYFTGVPTQYPDSMPRSVILGGVWGLSHAFHIDSNLTFASGSQLTFSGQRLVVGGDLTTTGTVQLVMSSASDSLDIGGTATWSGSSALTGMTAGATVFRGDFVQVAGAADNYSPSGTHRSRFVGSSPQSVTFATPGLGVARFRDLLLENVAGVTFASDFAVSGTTTVSAGTLASGAGTAGLAGSLNSGYADWQISNTLFSGAPVAYPDSFARNVFVATPWLLTKPVTVDSTLTIGGSGTIQVNSHDVIVGGDLTVSGSLTMVNIGDSVEVGGDVLFNSSSVAGGLSAGVLVLRGDFTQVAGSSQNFSVATGHLTRFAGSAPQTINFATPGAAASRFGAVTFQNPAGVTLATDMTVAGTATLTSGTLTGAGQTATMLTALATTYDGWQISTTSWLGAVLGYPDSLPLDVEIANTMVLTKPFKVGGSFTVQTGGTLTLDSFPMRVAGDFTQSGRLQVLFEPDTLDVGGNFLVNSPFDGTGDLGEGRILLRGGFQQVAGSATNFAPQPFTWVEFLGTGGHTVQFATPGITASRFGRLHVMDSLTLLSDIAVSSLTTLDAAARVVGPGRTSTMGSLDDPSFLGWRVGTTVIYDDFATLPDTITTDLVVQGTLSIQELVYGSVTIESGGTIQLGNKRSVIVGGLTQGGRLVMGFPNDTLEVQGPMVVTSSLTGDGDLTTGVLTLLGGFQQVAGAADNFAPSGSHTTQLTGAGGHTVQFATPGLASGTSHFNQLLVADSIEMLSDVAATGDVTLSGGQLVGGAHTGILGASLFDPTFLGWRPGATVSAGRFSSLPTSMTTELTILDTFFVSAPMTVDGTVTLGGSAYVNLTGHPWTVTGNFIQGGELGMFATGDSLDVAGSFIANSAQSGDGDLVAGVIRIGGDFQQVAGAADNFVATAPHTTRFHGAVQWAVTFATPGELPGNSHFGDLVVESGTQLELGSDVVATGSFTASGLAGFTTVAPAQHRIAVGDLFVDGAIFTRVRVEAHATSNNALFDNIAFQDQDPSLIQLSLEVPGETGDTIKLTNVTFNGVPTTGGYVYVADSVGNDAPSVIGFYNSSPLNGALYTTTEGSVGDIPVIRWSELTWLTQPSNGTELLPILAAPQIQAVDPSGVLLSGFNGTVTLAFFTDPSGGSALLGGNSVTAVGGIATFDSLTVSLAGIGYQLQATTSPLALGVSAPSTAFTIDLPIPAGTTTVFNNGGGDNDWFNAANWTAGLPDSADNVYIQPSQTAVLGSFARVGHLALGSGASLVLNNNLAVDSSVVAGNTISGGGFLYAQGTGTLSGQVGELVVVGQYTVPTGDQLSAQSINISGPLATLDPGQAQITAFDSLRTEAGARLNIGYPGASVTVQGMARFTGGASALTDGTLYLGGDFAQDENVGAFSPATGFQTVFNGGGIQTAQFFSPDSLSDRFQHVSVENGGVVNFVGTIPVMGDLSMSSGTINVLGVTTVAGDINSSTGAVLQGSGTLQVLSTLNFGGPYAVAHTSFVGTGQTIFAQSAAYDTLSVVGTALLGGPIDAGTVLVLGGQLLMGGNKLTVTGDFVTGGGGQFAMNNPADTLIVGGNFNAAGGSTTGLLNAGLLEITGSFNQSADGALDGFRADSGHTTRFVGAVERVIAFGSPVLPSDPFSTGNSRFGRLELMDGIDSLATTVAAVEDILVANGAVTNMVGGLGGLATPVNVTVLSGVVQFDPSDLSLGGVLDFQPTAPVFQAGTTLFFGDGQSVPALPYNNLSVAYGNATLAGNTTATGLVKLGISDEGPGFPGTLDIGGFALTAAELQTVGLGTLRMDGATDSVDVAQIDLNGGYSNELTDGILVVRGPFYMSGDVFGASGLHRTRFESGAATPLWNISAEVNANQFNKVEIVAGSTVLFNQFSVGAINVVDSLVVIGSLQQANPGKKLVVFGPLVVGGGGSLISDTVELHGTFAMGAGTYSTFLTRYAGGTQTVNPTPTYQRVEITGGASLSGPTTVNDELRIAGFGFLDIGGNNVSITNALRVVDAGVLVMMNAAGVVNTDTAQFAGGNSDGLLTAGTLRARTLRQESTTSTRSYRATGTHITEIGTPLGGPNYEINFQSGGPVGSQIQDLSLNDGGVGGVPTVIVGNVPVSGRLFVASEGSGGVVGGAGSVLMVGDSLINNGQIDFAVDTMELWGGIQTDPNTLANVVTRFAGTGQFIPDSQGYQQIEVTGTVGLETGATAAALTIREFGQLTLTGFQQVIVSGNFTTANNGTLAMNGTAPDLFIGGDATFGGGNSTGLLTAGNIRVVGNFTTLSTNSTEPFTANNTGVRFQGSAVPQFVTLDPATFGNFRGIGVTNPNGIIITGLMVVTDSVGTSGPIIGDSLYQFGNFFMNSGAQLNLRVLKTSGLYVGTPSAYVVGRTHLTNANSVPNVVFDTLVINALGAYTFFPVNANELIVAGTGSPFSNGSPSAFELDQAGPNAVRSAITGNVVVEGNAYLRLGDDTVAAGGNFVTQNGGRLIMNDPIGSLEVGTNAVFDGGSTEGLLNAGRIFVNGHFHQPGNGSPSAFAPSGATVEFFSFAPHNLAFADPDSSYLPAIAAPSSLTLVVIGRARIAGGLSSGILNLNGDSLWIEGQLSPGGATSINLNELRVADLYQFMNVASFNVGTGHLTGPMNLPINADSLIFDSLFVHDSVQGQLSQLIRTTYLEVAGTDNPRNLTGNPGRLYLIGGDGSTTVVAEGDAVVRGAGALIHNDAGSMDVFGNLTVDQAGQLMAPGYNGDGLFDVEGNVVIDGTCTDSLIAGRLYVNGNFTQLASSCGGSYTPEPGFVTQFTGNGTHVVSFASPSDAAGTGSHFGGLAVGDILPGQVIEIAGGNTWVEGALATTGSSGATIRNTSPLFARLTTRDMAVQSITFDHMGVRFEKFGPPAAGTGNVDNVDFVNFLADEIQFEVNLPGRAAGQFDWSIDFSPLSAAGTDTGKYITVNDNDGPTPIQMFVSLSTNQAFDPSVYFVATGGAGLSPFIP